MNAVPWPRDLFACDVREIQGSEPDTLIGWSMGGWLARELARERPDLVRRVITLGTPVIGGPKYTIVARIYRRRGLDIEAIAAEVGARNQISLLVPVTAIYSPIDAIVAWQACIDSTDAAVEHVEVRTTHVGFGFSPEVYEIIAGRLALDGMENEARGQRGVN